jgi:large subunit ribosomal protein L24
MHVKKGDEVVILTGKDKGKKGTIVKSLPKINKVIVEGLNQVKKHMKPRRTTEKGTTVTISLPMNASNVALAAGKSVAKPTVKKTTAKVVKETVSKPKPKATKEVSKEKTS